MVKNLIKDYKYYLYFVVSILVFMIQLIFGQSNLSNDGSFLPFNEFNLVGTILMFLLIIISYLGLIFFAYKLKIFKIDKKIYIFSAFAFIFFIYFVFLILFKDYSHLYLNYPFASSLNGTLFPQIDALDKLHSIIDTFLMILMLFHIIFLLNNFNKKDFMLRTFSFIYLALVLTMIIYSLIVESEFYIGFIENPAFISKYFEDGVCRSYLRNSNGLGINYFFTSLVFFFLAHSFQKKRIGLLMFPILFLTLFTGSRTSFSCQIYLIIAFSIYSLQQLYFKNRKMFVIFLSIYLVILLLILLEIFAFRIIRIKEEVNDEVKVYTLYDILVKYFVELNKRADIFKLVLPNMTQNDLFLGLGINLNNYYLRWTCGTSYQHYYFHNGYISLFTSGGIFLCVVYLLGLIYFGYVAIKSSKNNPLFIGFIILTFIPYLFYQLSEEFPIFYNVFASWFVTYYYIGSIFLKEKDQKYVVLSNYKNLQDTTLIKCM